MHMHTQHCAGGLLHQHAMPIFHTALPLFFPFNICVHTASCPLLACLQGASKGQQAAPKAPAAAAGASKLAQYLCDPPPLRPNGKEQSGGTQLCANNVCACAKCVCIHVRGFMPGWGGGMRCARAG